MCQNRVTYSDPNVLNARELGMGMGGGKRGELGGKWRGSRWTLNTIDRMYRLYVDGAAFGLSTMLGKMELGIVKCGLLTLTSLRFVAGPCSHVLQFDLTITNQSFVPAVLFRKKVNCGFCLQVTAVRSLCSCEHNPF